MPGQVTGTIGDQDVRLENAATESTLALLVTAIDKLASKSGKGGKEGKLQELYNKRLEETNKKKEEEAERLDELNEQLKKSKEKWKQFGNDMSAIIGSVFSNTTVGLNQLANVFDNMGPLGQIAGALTRVVNQNVEIFRELSNVGIDLGSSIFAAQEAAAKAGLPLDVFANAVKNGAPSLAILGGSASEGAKRFTEVSSAMRKGNFAMNMQKLGFTMADVAEHTIGYMEQLTMLGKAQKMSDQEMAEGAQNYLLELDKLTRTTGMSRKEAEAALKKQSEDKRLKALMAGMDEKARLALSGVTTALEKASPEMAEGFKELVATNGVPISDFGKALARNNPELLEQAKAARAGRLDVGEFNKTIRNAAANNSALSEEEEKLHAYLVARGKASPYADRVALMQLRNFGKEMEGIGQAQQDAMNGQAKAVAGFDEAITQVANALKVILLPIVEVVATGLGVVASAIGWTMTQFGKIGTAIEGLIGKDAFDGLKTATKYVISALVALGVAMYAKSKFSAMGSAAEALGGKGGGAGKMIGGAGGGIGKGIQGIGEGVGKGVGGMLGGLAEGLSKLGSPKVLLGVVALAGIGATMFITAKALQQFASVSWEDMAKGFVALAGLGALGLILSLAAIPIAIGAGVIALLGASLLPLAAAIAIVAPHLDTISEKISKLADIDTDALGNIGVALGSLGAGLAALGAGNVIEAIGSFFGGDISTKLAKMGSSATGIVALGNAMDQLDFSKLDASNVDFGNLEIGAKRAQRLAEQLAAVKVQMEKIQSPTLVESLKGAFDTLSTKITAVMAPEEGKGTPKRSSEVILSDIGKKLDLLNTQVGGMLEIQERTAPDIRKTAKNTRGMA